MPLSEELQRAIAILDGSGRDAPAMPNSPGLYWSPRGSRLVIEPGHADAFERAIHCEIAVFGQSKLVFGVAYRFADAVGFTSPWGHSFYSWHKSDPGHWPIPPVADARLLQAEERVIELVCPADAAAGRPDIVRILPISIQFALALRSRVATAKSATFKTNWHHRAEDQVKRITAGDLGRIVADRFAGDLHTSV